jgi:hypothetical protein
MSRYIMKSGHLEFHYGYNEQIGEYWYCVYDKSRKTINNGLIDQGGSKTTGMPTIVLAEKCKQFKAPIEHIQKILWMRKI